MATRHVAPVYLIGPRYGHHARHSGYEGFSRHLGVSAVYSPISTRFLKPKAHPMLGWRIDQAIGFLAGRRCYSLGILLMEAAAIGHLLSHPGSLYHVLFGDTDIWLLGRLRRLAHAGVVATFHEAGPGLEWLRIDRIVRTIDAAILVSESQRPYFEALLPPERIFVVPHGVDADFFRPAPSLTDAPVCMTVGGHTRDFSTLSQAIDRVRRVRPDARFVAVGTSHGHEGPPFVHPSVEFRYGISDEALRDLYQRSRVAVFCFRQTTANNGTLEAMACGVPVVSTDIGGAREYVGRDAAILCPPEDPDAVAAAILAIFGDDRLAHRLGRAGRERAEQFDFRSISAQHAAVYSSVAERVL
jgi:glycosyltransferase involved in cell wall biosynthesis